MAVWSSLKSSLTKFTGIVPKKGFSASNVRHMSGGHDEHRVMEITPSRFQYKKFKDLIHFYVLLGAIPLAGVIFYSNVFIGPAKLAEIPDDYEPKHWEYHRHPITRWLARYIFGNPQQDYEKYLHQLYEEDEKMKIRNLQRRVAEVMGERKDYQAYYYVPVDGKYFRIVRQESDEIAEVGGFIPPKEGPHV